MKKLLIALICTLTAIPALALDERSAARIARNYSEAVACQLEDARYQAAQVQAGDPELNGLGDVYVVSWTGDVGCSGGNGTVFPNFTVVEHRGFMSADPVVVSDYEFPELTMKYMTGFSSSDGVLLVEGLTYGENDRQHEPSKRVAYRIRFDGDRFVIE